MSRETFARWTCNVCKVVKETAADKQPAAWIGYGYTQPGVPAGEQRSIGHLCPECAACLDEALAKRTAREEEAGS